MVSLGEAIRRCIRWSVVRARICQCAGKLLRTMRRCFTSCGTTLRTTVGTPSASRGREVTKPVRCSRSARLTWAVEADSHFHAMTMTLYYEHMGWGTYTTDPEWDRRTYAEHGWE